VDFARHPGENGTSLGFRAERRHPCHFPRAFRSQACQVGQVALLTAGSASLLAYVLLM
jgi:hypothetical protein